MALKSLLLLFFFSCKNVSVPFAITRKSIIYLNVFSLKTQIQIFNKRLFLCGKLSTRATSVVRVNTQNTQVYDKALRVSSLQNQYVTYESLRYFSFFIGSVTHCLCIMVHIGDILDLRSVRPFVGLCRKLLIS